jgi:hypothetical protein
MLLALSIRKRVKIEIAYDLQQGRAFAASSMLIPSSSRFALTSSPAWDGFFIIIL